jgi:hypothetical protein
MVADWELLDMDDPRACCVWALAVRDAPLASITVVAAIRVRRRGFIVILIFNKVTYI